jgi:hypothetical protein
MRATWPTHLIVLYSNALITGGGRQAPRYVAPFFVLVLLTINTSALRANVLQYPQSVCSLNLIDASFYF